jgi:monoamine oxidase
MVTECQTIESNRCSILYSTPISQVELLASNQIQLTTSNDTSQIFDTVVVVTTATVTQFIDFEPRLDFIQKYLAIRQVHYDCSTKILLSFNASW